MLSRLFDGHGAVSCTGVYQICSLLSDVKICIFKKLYRSFFFGPKMNILEIFILCFLCVSVADKRATRFRSKWRFIRKPNIYPILDVNSRNVNKSLPCGPTSVYLCSSTRNAHQIFRANFLSRCNATLLLATMWVKELIVEMLMSFELLMEIICRFSKTANSE